MNNFKVEFILPIILLLIVNCGNSRYLSESKIQKQYPNSKKLNETAAFLSGMDLSVKSPFYSISQGREYKKYRKTIGAIWDKYREMKLQKIETWRKTSLPGIGKGVVFYPFSGPDILNALAFYPEAEEFIMIGLELPGTVPDPAGIEKWRMVSGLWNIRKAVRTLLSLNLFRTREMQVDIRSDSFNSITGIMMFFLARYGYEILDVKNVTITPQGQMVTGARSMQKGFTSGVEIVFRKGEGTALQKARFFRVDLSDGSLKSLGGYTAFLDRYRGFTTFLKSASYLLSYDNFSTIRNYIISRSSSVVQGDSGIPFKYFSEENWDFSFYGRYRVIEMFKSRFQPDLNMKMKKLSLGVLPFSYGYGFIPSKSNIMVARRKKKKQGL